MINRRCKRVGGPSARLDEGERLVRVCDVSEREWMIRKSSVAGYFICGGSVSYEAKVKGVLKQVAQNLVAGK